METGDENNGKKQGDMSVWKTELKIIEITGREGRDRKGRGERKWDRKAQSKGERWQGRKIENRKGKDIEERKRIPNSLCVSLQQKHAEPDKHEKH